MEYSDLARKWYPILHHQIYIRCYLKFACEICSVIFLLFPLLVLGDPHPSPTGYHHHLVIELLPRHSWVFSSSFRNQYLMQVNIIHAYGSYTLYT